MSKLHTFRECETACVIRVVNDLLNHTDNQELLNMLLEYNSYQQTTFYSARTHELIQTCLQQRLQNEVPRYYITVS